MKQENINNKIGLFLMVFALLIIGCSKDPILNPEIGTFTDSQDNHVYQWVRISGQIWMAENLAYLPSVSPSSAKSETSYYFYVYGYEGTSISEAKNLTNYSIYGVLYNWPAAMNGAFSSTMNPSGIQGICPSGWHLPSDAEWTALIAYLGRSAGSKMKETGINHWTSPNSGATNASGFTALPGGYRGLNRRFNNLDDIALFWAASEYDALRARYCSLRYYTESVHRDFSNKSRGFSVRCVKD